VSGQYTAANWLLGRAALEAGQPRAALDYFQDGLAIPSNLGEIAPDGEQAQLIYYSGLAHAQLGQAETARQSFERVLGLPPGWGLSLVEYYQALALLRLDREAEGRARLSELRQRAAELAETGLPFNYFFSGNPNPTFEADPQWELRLHFKTLAGLAALSLGDAPGARQALSQVLAADPSSLAAHEALQRLG
jgi:tetratricopeptide (TPR) repeat protein